MAEKKSFFRKIFSFGSDSEAERTPEGGSLPRPSDTETGRPDAAEPESRPVAAANAGTDTEAGADPREEGGITPLKDDADVSQDAPKTVADGAETEKKTLNT